MQESIIQLLQSGKICQTEKFIINDKGMQTLYCWSHDPNNITYYTYIACKLIYKADLNDHLADASALIKALWTNKDGNNMGLFHARQILELYPEDVSFRVLSFSFINYLMS